MSSIDYSMVGSEKKYYFNEHPPPHKHFQEGEFRQVISQYGEFGKKQHT